MHTDTNQVGRTLSSGDVSLARLQRMSHIHFVNPNIDRSRKLGPRQVQVGQWFLWMALGGGPIYRAGWFTLTLAFLRIHCGGELFFSNRCKPLQHPTPPFNPPQTRHTVLTPLDPSKLLLAKVKQHLVSLGATQQLYSRPGREQRYILQYS